jgi:hypothetical protein
MASSRISPGGSCRIFPQYFLLLVCLRVYIGFSPALKRSSSFQGKQKVWLHFFNKSKESYYMSSLRNRSLITYCLSEIGVWVHFVSKNGEANSMLYIIKNESDFMLSLRTRSQTAYSFLGSRSHIRCIYMNKESNKCCLWGPGIETDSNTWPNNKIQESKFRFSGENMYVPLYIHKRRYQYLK